MPITGSRHFDRASHLLQPKLATDTARAFVRSYSRARLCADRRRLHFDGIARRGIRFRRSGNDQGLRGRTGPYITAARMLGIAPEQVSKEERRGAKNVNFGAIRHRRKGISCDGVEQLSTGSGHHRGQALARRHRAGLPSLRTLATGELCVVLSVASHPDRQRRCARVRTGLPVLPAEAWQQRLHPILQHGHPGRLRRRQHVGARPHR
jgi:hypothetical protein